MTTTSASGKAIETLSSGQFVSAINSPTSHVLDTTLIRVQDVFGVLLRINGKIFELQRTENSYLLPPFDRRQKVWHGRLKPLPSSLMSTSTYVSVSQASQLPVRPQDPSFHFQVSRMAQPAFQNPTVASLDRHAFLVGTPIAHSLSPLLHHSLYSTIHENWGQVLYDTPDLRSFLEMLRADETSLGSGVTMPYKLEVIPYLDELTPEGKAIGAINTIFYKTDSKGQRTFCGTNTDCIGVRDAFLWNVSDPSMFKGRPGLVVGGGGTCRAAVYALQTFLGCSPIYIINRDKKEVDMVIDECKARGFDDNILHVSTIAQAQELQAPGAIVSAVPDFEPVTENEKIAREALAVLLNKSEKGALLEMCYHPSPNTQISALATSSGWPVIVGTEAMVGQGFEQARLWTGIEITPEMRAAARRSVQDAISTRHRL